jgi:hypothetical protein
MNTINCYLRNIFNNIFIGTHFLKVGIYFNSRCQLLWAHLVSQNNILLRFCKKANLFSLYFCKFFNLFGVCNLKAQNRKLSQVVAHAPPRSLKSQKRTPPLIGGYVSFCDFGTRSTFAMT